METRIIIEGLEFKTRRISTKKKGDKVYTYEYDDDGFTGKRVKAAHRKSDNICVSCGKEYLGKKQQQWLEVGIITGKTFNSGNPESGGWTFLNDNLEAVKIGIDCECGLCGKVKETFNYRTFNYLGLGDSKPNKN